MIKSYSKKAINTATAISFICMIIFAFYGYQSGIFSSRETMETFLQSLGIWVSLVFIIIQAVQVIIPIIPGGVSCLVGVTLFGTVKGFIYNYIGVCIGSIGAFLLARKYGQPLVFSIIGEKKYEKFSKWLDKKKKFDRFFAAAIFFPCAPDDILCYIAGLTKMNIWKFVLIILAGKPASIALYSLGLWTFLNQFID